HRVGGEAAHVGGVGAGADQDGELHADFDFAVDLQLRSGGECVVGRGDRAVDAVFNCDASEVGVAAADGGEGGAGAVDGFRGDGVGAGGVDFATVSHGDEGRLG